MSPVKISNVDTAVIRLEARDTDGALSPVEQALMRLATRAGNPPLSRHTNLVIDEDMDALIVAYKEDPELHLNRSEAIRMVFLEGVKALLVQAANRA
jgi:hypothetical protein